MKKLYLDTKNGRILIDPAFAEKYNLRIGMESPFTHDLITDENGETPVEEDPRDRGLPDGKGELINDEIAQLDNGMTLQTSEMLDITEGVDSTSK